MLNICWIRCTNMYIIFFRNYITCRDRNKKSLLQGQMSGHIIIWPVIPLKLGGLLGNDGYRYSVCMIVCVKGCQTNAFMEKIIAHQGIENGGELHLWVAIMARQEDIWSVSRLKCTENGQWPPVISDSPPVMYMYITPQILQVLHRVAS